MDLQVAVFLGAGGASVFFVLKLRKQNKQMAPAFRSFDNVKVEKFLDI